MPTDKPNFTDYSFLSLVRKADKDHNKPEVVYEFNNKVKKVSTDRTDNGLYKQ